MIGVETSNLLWLSQKQAICFLCLCLLQKFILDCQVVFGRHRNKLYYFEVGTEIGVLILLLTVVIEISYLFMVVSSRISDTRICICLRNKLIDSRL